MVPVRVTVTGAPTGRSPSSHRASPATIVQSPSAHSPSVRVTPSGAGSVRTTARATEGPALRTTTCHRISSPAIGAPDSRVLLALRSAAVVTVPVAVPVAVSALGSTAEEVAVAEFVIDVPTGRSAGTDSVRVAVVDSPTSKVSHEHRTRSSSAGVCATASYWQLPPAASAPTKPSGFGSTSIRSTSRAWDGPRLVMRIA